MISFIIIAKNEAITLEKCFESIFNTIKTNRFSQYEVLYVDSNSEDNSIEVAKQYEEIKIFRLTKFCSPAVARNIGAKEASAKTLVFVDGDTLLNPKFPFFKKKSNRQKPFVSGLRPDIPKNNIKEAFSFTSKDKKPCYATLHGTFIIDKSIFTEVNGFNEKYRNAGGEDIDFFFRLEKLNYKIEYINHVIAYHLTVDYLDIKRMWQMLWNGSQLYARSVLYRDHFLKKHLWKILLRREYSLISLIILFVLCLVFSSALPLIIYALIILGRVVFQKNKKWKDVPNRLVYYPIRDVYVFLGFLLFHPDKPKNIEYKKIL